LQAAGYSAYKRVQTETASPGELVLLLYDALLNDLTRAEERLAARDLEKAHRSLVRAQEILLELIASLDMNAGDIARRLAPLYEYQYQCLLDANVRKDARPVAEVIRLITPLRNAWTQVIRNSQAASA
jgi:flagellar secretion chaperone FliS